MANKKMTYAVAIDKAINGEVNAEVAERLMDLKDMLAKRASAKSKAKAEAQDTEKATIVSALATLGKPVQVGEVVKVINDVKFNSQKVTALLVKLVADGKVAREVDKKKAFYSLVQEETSDEVDIEETAQE
jgi:DNA-binding transcriptional regulator YbjK